MNRFSLIASFFTARIFGLTVGALLCLLNIYIGLVFGPVAMFISFYGLLNQTWERNYQTMNRRFNDNS